MLEKALRDLFIVKNFKISLLFLMIMISILLGACYPVTSSKGVVKDVQQQPIVDAIVRVGGKSVRPMEQRTKGDGTFDFGNIFIISHQDPIEIELTVEKEGFIQFRKQLTFNAQNWDEIILKQPSR